MFSSEFSKIFKNTIIAEHPRVTTFENYSEKEWKRLDSAFFVGEILRNSLRKNRSGSFFKISTITQFSKWEKRDSNTSVFPWILQIF